MKRAGAVTKKTTPDDAKKGSDFEGLNALKKQMNKLLHVAIELLDADAAAVVMTSDGVSHIIASRNLPKVFFSFSRDWAKSPYKLDANFDGSGLVVKSLLRLTSLMTGRQDTSVFWRRPLIITESYIISLQIYAFRTRPETTSHEKQLFRSVVSHLKTIVAPLGEALFNTGSKVAVLFTEPELATWIKSDENMHCLLDRDLKYVAASPSWIQRFNLRPDQYLGEVINNSIPAFFALMDMLGKRTVQNGISLPELEFVKKSSNTLQHFSLICSPIRPLDAKVDFLDVSVRVKHSEENELAEGFAEPGMPIEPTLDFLLGTLIKSRAIRLRDEVSFMTVRRWRASIKEHQLVALRANKKSARTKLASIAAAECAEEIFSLVGRSAFKFVVPIPCGHSPKDRCFSSKLAQALGARMNLPVIHAFAHMDQPGSSHPKTNVSRHKMVQVRYVPGPAILIDDVATSGVHLAEGSEILKANGTDTFAIAWIGGDGNT